MNQLQNLKTQTKKQTWIARWSLWEPRQREQRAPFMQSKQYILHSLLWESAWTLHWTKKLVWRSGRSHSGHLLFSTPSSSSKPPPYSKKTNKIYIKTTTTTTKEKYPSIINVRIKCIHDVRAKLTMILLLLGLISLMVSFWSSSTASFGG